MSVTARTPLLAGLLAALVATGLGASLGPAPAAVAPAGAAVTQAAATGAVAPGVPAPTPGVSAPAPGEPVVVDDFAGGVTAVNHPEGAGEYGVWYDATHNAFATPSATTVAGEPAMRIDDGGFINGVYAIYQGAVPASGEYRVEADIHVVEAGAADAIRAYQLGAATGAEAAHRGLNPSALPATPAVGSYVGLTTGDDTAVGPQAVTTSVVSAAAGDDLLVAFGTDVTSGGWNASSAGWSGSHVVVGQIRLLPLGDPGEGPIVVDNDDGPDAYTETGEWRTSGAPGYGGGTYRFAFAGADSTASWTAQLPEAGTYDVEVVYVAGTNRASTARYRVPTVDEVVEATVDQQEQSLVWVRLAEVELPAGPATVTLDAASSEPGGQVVIADAVRFVPDPGPPPIDEPEMRLAAITVFDDIDDVDSIQRTVDLLADLHYNAVAVHTRYRGDATYVPNKTNADFPNVEPRSPAAGDVDVLAEYTERGHAAGLAVFAYVNTHLVTEGSSLPTDPNHVVNRHPDWVTYEYGGGTPVQQRPGGEGLWLDPALPQVSGYLADIAGDIMSNYDCDGIILDRVRYPQSGVPRATRDYGYHPTAIERFNHRHAATGVPDPDDPDWITFRQRAVTRSVTEIYRTITDLDPEHELLAYPLGRFGDALAYNYQDWPDWLHRGVVDGALPQVYNQNDAAWAASLGQNRNAYDGDRLFGVTLDAFRPGNDLAGRIETVRQADFDGTSPFRHGTMAPLGYYDDLRQGWDGVAQWPQRPGKGEPTARLDVRPAVAEPAGEPGADATAGEWGWTVTNPNAESLYLTWWELASEESGTLYARPGETSWRTPAGDAGVAVIVTRWYADGGRPRVDLAWQRSPRP